MNKIFESHAHYDDKWFDGDRYEVIEKLPSCSIEYVVNVGTDMQSSYNGRDLADRYPFFYFAVGVHPQSAADLPGDYLDQFAKLSEHPKCVAIGEIGLDYYFKEPTRDIQQKVFIEQMELAKKLDKPIIIHDRDAHEDILAILKKYRLPGVVHRFSGNAEMAMEVVKLGMYLGLGGAITFYDVRKTAEIIRQIPLDHFVIETDCPYAAPVPMKDQRCDSSMLPYVCQKIADIKKISVDEVIVVTNQNAKNLYRMK